MKAQSSKDKQSQRRRFIKTAGPISELCRDIGTKIRIARMGAGLTQKGLASKLNISQQIISRVESGRQNISLETLKTIAEGLGHVLNIDFQRR